MIPARWYPDHTSSQWRTPAPGDLVALEHAVWRVIDVRPRPRDLWDTDDQARVARQGEKYAPQAVILRPARLTGDDPKHRSQDHHVCTWHSAHQWDVYRDEHYPVCVQCREPTPCRERVGARVAEREMADMASYETPGVCPACAEPVSARQDSRTFQDNIEIPGGPPVTYHIGRRRCRYEAAEYEKRCAVADPRGPDADLFGGAT